MEYNIYSYKVFWEVLEMKEEEVFSNIILAIDNFLFYIMQNNLCVISSFVKHSANMFLGSTSEQDA